MIHYSWFITEMTFNAERQQTQQPHASTSKQHSSLYVGCMHMYSCLELIDVGVHTTKRIYVYACFNTLKIASANFVLLYSSCTSLLSAFKRAHCIRVFNHVITHICTCMHYLHYLYVSQLN
jgi:hypothetical protein